MSKNRSGIKSSEFYITIGTLCGAFVLAFKGIGAGEIAAFTGIAIAYVGGRSYVKK